MLYQLLFNTVTLAAVVAAVPYPPDATVSVPPPAGTPFFGKLKGNNQPSKTISKGPTPALTGGYVQNGYVATWSINNYDGIGPGTDSYHQYNGDGTTGAGWPARSQWVSFVDMFNNNKAIMFNSCGQFGVGNDNGPEVGAIYDSIQTVASETQLDHRFILAVIIQESGGCVRAPTTNFGVRNPGIMQTHNGDGTCNDSDGSTQGNAVPYQIQSPCPTPVITQMIRDGSAGTNSGDGLAQCVNLSGASDDSAFYKAVRIYNSGSVDSSGDLERGVATHCYASDIANRLTGWVSAPHACNLDG